MQIRSYERMGWAFQGELRTTLSAYVLELIEASNTCAWPPPEVSSGSFSLMRRRMLIAAERSWNGASFGPLHCGRGSS